MLGSYLCFIEKTDTHLFSSTCFKFYLEPIQIRATWKLGINRPTLFTVLCFIWSYFVSSLIEMICSSSVLIIMTLTMSQSMYLSADLMHTVTFQSLGFMHTSHYSSKDLIPLLVFSFIYFELFFLLTAMCIWFTQIIEVQILWAELQVLQIHMVHPHHIVSGLLTY